jgi:hypothetical protein
LTAAYRDLGLPAARVPSEGGSGCRDSWPKSILPQFLPSSVAEEPAFAALLKSGGFSGAIYAPMIWSVRLRQLLT